MKSPSPPPDLATTASRYRRWILAAYVGSLLLPAASVASAGSGPAVWAWLWDWQAFVIGFLLPGGLIANLAICWGVYLFDLGLWPLSAAAGGLALLSGGLLLVRLWGAHALVVAHGFWLASAALLTLLSVRLARRREAGLSWRGGGTLSTEEKALLIGLAAALLCYQTMAPVRLGRYLEAPALKLMLAGRSDETRLWAAEELSKAGLGGGPTIPLLIRTLRSPESGRRLRAAEGLARYGAQARLALPDLLAALKGPDRQVAAAAAHALGAMGPAAESAVAGLIEALRSEDSLLAGAAVQALGEIGPGAKEAAPALIARLDRTMGDPQALESLRLIVGELPSFDDAPTAEVLRALQSKDPVVRHFADAALSRRSVEGAVGVAGLSAALKSRNRYVRRQAAQSLGRLGASAASAVASLAEMLRGDGDPANRAEAAAALGRIGPKAGTAAPALADRLLADPEALVRLHAASALGDIGPAAKAAVPALIKARSENDASVRGWAADALVKIDPDTASGLEPLPALKTSRFERDRAAATGP